MTPSEELDSAPTRRVPWLTTLRDCVAANVNERCGSLSLDSADPGRPDSDRHEGLGRLIHLEELQRLQAGLAEMPPRERALVAGRFGLGRGGGPLTFRALGDSHGLSKEWARVMTAGALERLRASLECETAS